MQTVNKTTAPLAAVTPVPPWRNVLAHFRDPWRTHLEYNELLLGLRETGYICRLRRPR